ncbi:DUF4132 domain-containing protein [Pseudomonas sp. F1_0610]|uniref:DUF4132 domain-containing protein n=1 Tax=Pseudomonas sp. F1_0610 TaxID=3114284 RepID=UPI0039C0A0B9
MSTNLQKVYDELMGTTGLLSKLSKLFEGKPAVQYEVLVDAFVPLARINEQYPARIIDFILQGNDSGILVELESQQDTLGIVLIDNPGCVSYWYSHHDISAKEIRKFIQKTSSARQRFYTLWSKDFTDEQIIRFAKVLAAICGGRNTSISCPLVPLWFLYLVLDGLSTELHNIKDSQFQQVRGRWTVQKLHDLLASEQSNTAELVLNMLFDRRNIDSPYYLDRLDHFFKLTDVDSYITQHIELFKQLPKQLSAPGQVCLARFLGNHKDICTQVPELVINLATSSLKTVRSEAEGLLSVLDAEILFEPLKEALFNGDSKQRVFAANLIARKAENKALLEQALEQEKTKTVVAAIESALARFDSIDSASTMESLEIPPFAPIAEVELPEAKVAEILQQNYNEMLEEARLRAESEAQENETREKRHQYHWAQDNYRRLKRENAIDYAQLAAFLNGKGNISKRSGHDLRIIEYKNRISSLPEYSALHHLRTQLVNSTAKHISLWQVFRQGTTFAQFDLRATAQALTAVGAPNAKRLIADYFLSSSYYNPFEDFNNKDLVWPFFAENTELLDEALKLRPSQNNNQNRYYEFSEACAIQILEQFPSLPAHYVPRILELALGEGKSLRPIAQATLESIPNIHLRAEEALASSKQEIRITAAEWLARLNQPSSCVALNVALKKEKRETVRAALLTALEALGEDISAYLSPKVLQQEAETGLKAKLPTSFAWFDFSLIPALTWENGKAVAPAIIQWWIVLAVKLKDPSGNALLQRYVGLLSKDSQKKLGSFLLHTFIAQDTRHPSLEEAMAEAQQSAPQRLANYQSGFKRYPEYYAKYEHFTLEDTIEEIKREVLSRYLGSATSDKGMLALCSGIEGHVAVTAVRQFMRDHYPRYNQIMAMLMGIGNSNDPLIIQLLLSISRRYRTNAVQEKARELITAIAQRNGWTPDELADRTIPTAGMDETGVISLDYGERVFTARMDDKYKFVLLNPEGKEIKALPEPRKTEDADLVKDAKKLLSNSKKELKQVIELQSARLFEAMCAERLWSAADWKEYLFAHPVMNPLIQRLVWLEVDTDGNLLTSFRPTEDGSLINVEDDEVELAENSQLKLAHAALLEAELSKAWLAHFKDYKVKPLFAQMINSIPDISKNTTGLIEDRKGWVTDTFTLRGVLTKMGYKRSDAEDAGSFDHYSKAFDSLGLYINIHFSGSYVPEENIPAVLYSLSFANGRSWSAQEVALKDIPPILLAEGYADYLAVAAACGGFDPEWKKKGLW